MAAQAQWMSSQTMSVSLRSFSFKKRKRSFAEEGRYSHLTYQTAPAHFFALHLHVSLILRQNMAKYTALALFVDCNQCNQI